MATPLLVTRSSAYSHSQVGEVVCTARPLPTALVLLLTDAIALVVAGWVGFHLWSRVNNTIGPEFYFALWPALAMSLIIYAFAGLYPGAGLSPVEELRRLVLGTSVVYLVSAAAIFLSKDAGKYSRGVFLCSWLFAVFLVPLQRAFVRSLFATRKWWGVPVVVLGAGKNGRLMTARLQAQPELGLKPVAYLDDDTAKHGDCSGIPVAGPLSRAPELARDLGIRHAIIAMPGMSRQGFGSVLERVGSTFTRLIVVPDLFGMASLWVSPRDIGGVLGLEVRQNLLVPVNRWFKRGLDLLMAVLLGIAAAPVVAVAVLLIKRGSPGPAFYTQEREGERGRTITIHKLRTMHLNAEKLLSLHLSKNPDAQQQWERYFKLKNDPRILPGIGQFLRRTSLDELPQLWSVIKGEMSLVGPRPFPYYHLDQFDSEFRSLRSRVAPGLTGLWQVSARSNGDLSVQEALDTYYIRNWSLWLDVHILARTVRAVVFQRGAY